MKILYHCEICGADIAEIDMDWVDEAKLGFDCLTGDERKAIISINASADTMDVQSLCDACIKELGLEQSNEENIDTVVKMNVLH